MSDDNDLRKQIDKLLDQEFWIQADNLLKIFWKKQSSLSAASYTISCYESLRSHLPLLPYRLAILRSFTIEPIVPLLRAAAFTVGIDLIVHVGDFNTYAQEILDLSSSLYSFDPAAVILAIQTRDIAPELWDRFADQSPSDVMVVIKQVNLNFETWIKTFRSHSQANLIIHSLEIPLQTSLGILDNQVENSQIKAIRTINQELSLIVAKNTGVYLLDYDSLIARYGINNWLDERKWLTMRMPISADNLIHIAKEWMRFINPLSGKILKVLVVDLDNTLWGGVIGEDGIAGIKISREYPGAMYQSLQRAILDLYHRGIIIAICSKNNFADAMEVIENHGGMILRSKNFAAIRINWNDKVQNLREIAADLNIGLEALAFLDDNPVERQRVRFELPEVTVIDLPENPADYAQALRDSPYFERLTISKEDRERGRYYAEQRQRIELGQSATSMIEFYRSLQQELEIAPISTGTIARVAQLTQKTNQFNLTTHRYSEQQITEMDSNKDWQIHTLSVRDRFGDNGLVGIAILHFESLICEIDTMLLSCRVIGRTVETSFLGYLIQIARELGAKKLQGWFLPTKKNAAAESFYSQHGFKEVERQEKGVLWSFDVEETNFILPEWNNVVIREGASNKK